MTQPQQEALIRRLNGSPKESLAAEWEIIILSALCKCGRIAYEKDFMGETRPDIYFQLGASGIFEFVADVRAVSDTFAHEQNPFDDFSTTVRLFLQRLGHSSAGIQIEVGHLEEGNYGRRKIRLALPPKNKLQKFVQIELGNFLEKISKNPESDACLNYQKHEVNFKIRYDGSKKRISSGSHISFTVPYSIRNTLMNALIEKGDQLARSGYAGTKGIIICDNGCDALNERSRVSGAFGCKQIVDAFLKAHNDIFWVFVLRIDQNNSFSRRGSVAIKPQFYWNSNRDEFLFRDTLSALERIFACVPQPEASPADAIRWLNGINGKTGRPFGGYTMHDKTIKVSARSLTELLAGKITPQEFLGNHGFKTHPANSGIPGNSFFERQLTDGNTLKNSFIERDEFKDDDWIVLEYSGPDPAISPYRLSC